MNLIRALLPSGVAAAEVLGDDPHAALLPDEEAALGRVVEVRRRQFTLGRACARRALAVLGLSPSAILPGPGRAPRWPNGVVGSITHCRGYTAAAVAPRSRFAALGIDAEEDGPLPAGVLGMVATKEERVWIAETGGGIPRDRLLFSAKESVFKAWYPLTGRWLDFHAAVVTVDLARATFRARLLIEGPWLNGRVIDRFSGRFLVTEGLVLTAVSVPAS